MASLAKLDIPVLILFSVAILIVVSVLWFSGPSLSGAVVAVPYEIPLSFITNKSTTLDVDFDFNISSLKLSGNFSGESFTVYLDANGQRYLITEGQNESIFFEQCIESCDIKASPPFSLDIIINNGTLQLSNLTYNELEIVTTDVAKKVEPKVLTNEPAEVIVLLDEDTKPEEILNKITDTGLEVKYIYNEFNTIAGTISKEDLDNLAANPDVKAIKADTQFQIMLKNSVPFIRVPQVWQTQISGTNITGNGETVCIIDTGVNYSHPALAANYAGGFDFVNNDTDPLDDHGHGTHVAGIIASNDGTYKGVSPGAKFVALKAFNSGGSGSLSDILAAIDWCVANKNVYNISVISMSFGDGGQYNESNCPTTFDEAFDAATSAGITLVAATGNNGYANGISLPACQKDVIAVGAVDNSDVVASWSNSGTALDLLAPGVSIVSTAINGGFTTMSGTSMATPHVSGVVALLQHYNMLKTNSRASPAQIKSTLIHSGVNVTDSKNNLTKPRVDAFAAISPLITIESPLNQTYSATKIDFNITLNSPINNALFSIDDGDNNTMTNDTETHWYNNSIENLAIGQHNTTFYVISDVNSSKTVYFTIIIDTTPPQIVLNSPENNSVLAIGQYINLSVSDDIQVDSVWYEKNNTNITLNLNGSNYLIDTSNWQKGVQNIIVYANDTSGNINFSNLVFNADSAPIVSNVTITPVEPYTNDDLVCNWTYSDADNDTENGTIVKWFLNNAEYSATNNQTIVNKDYTIKNQQWKCQVTPSDGLVYGTPVNSSLVTIQNSLPVVSSIYPNGSEKVSGVITLNASASDADGQSDIQIVKFYYSNNSGSTYTLIGNDTSASGDLYEISWNTSKVADGKNYRIKVEVIDNSNATAVKTSASNFVINNINEAPAITVTSPNGGEVWNGTKTIKWNATDPDDDTLTISIYYKTSNGTNWTKIESGLSNTGSYSWDTTSVPNGNYLINITAKDSGGLSASDVSDSSFTINNSESTSSEESSSKTNLSTTTTTSNLSNLSTPTFLTNKTIYPPLVESTEAQQFFANITKGISAKFLPNLTSLAVIEVTFKSKINVENVTAKIKKLNSVSIALENEDVYQYFELIAEGLSNNNLDKAIIKFKVPKEWASKYSSIYLATLLGTGWEKLPTTKSNETNNTIEYIATAKHLSVFAIVGSKSNTIPFIKIGKSYIALGVLASLIIIVLNFVLQSKAKLKKKKIKPKWFSEYRHRSSDYDEVPDFGFR